MSGVAETQSEVRATIVAQEVERAEQARDFFPEDDSDLRAYVTSVVDATVLRIQNILAAPTDKLSNTLWSNETGGHAGRLSALRTDAHALIDAADIIVGRYRA